MPLRRTDLDPEREAAVTAARTDLRHALEILAHESALAAKAARAKRAVIDLPAVYAATRRVERAEEACDLAVYDRDTAAGADG